MRVYKETMIDKKTGQKTKSRNFYIDFYDQYRRRHNLAAFPERRESLALADKIENLVTCQISGQQPGPELQQWIDKLPNRFKEKFSKWGLLEGCRVAATKLLSSHLGDWLYSQIAKGVNKKSHAEQQYNRATRVFQCCQFTYWQDIQASKLLQTINGLTKLQQRGKEGYTDTKKPLSPRSKSHYLEACKQFANWMEMDGRVSSNPIRHLKITSVIEAQHPRRPLTLDEIIVLMTYILNSRPLRFITGYERYLLYQIALETGLRANEIRTLTRKGFDFEQLKVQVASKHTKNKKTATLPLKPETAKAIQEFSKYKTPTTRVFRVPENGLSKMLRQDIENARKVWIEDAMEDSKEYRRRIESDFLSVQTDDGKIDFHSLRHTFGSLLAASGVHPKIAQELMRHSNINLTMGIYTHAQTSQVEAAVNGLPDLRVQSYDNKPDAC